MKTIETTAYHFDELSDDAKEKARDWYRQFVFSESQDWEHVYEDAKECGRLIGIEVDKIYFSGFCSQGDGASFEGSYKYQNGAAKSIRQHAPQDTELHRIADQLQEVQKRHFYRLMAYCQHQGHYQHSGCMSVDVEDSEDQYEDIGDAEDEITDLLRSFADWIYSQLEKEYDYQMSDESVDENIRCNGYEFTEAGERAR